MSTAIYGDIIPGGATTSTKIRAFLRTLHNLRQIAQNRQDLLLQQSHLTRLVYAADEAWCLPNAPLRPPSMTREELESDMRRSKKHRGYSFDRSIELSWTIHKRDILYIPLASWGEDVTWLRDQLGSADYSYDTRTDPPEGVSDAAHSKRGKVWDEVMAPSFKASELSTFLIAEIPDSIQHNSFGLLNVPSLKVPSLQERAERIAEEVVTNSQQEAGIPGRNLQAFELELRNPETPAGKEFASLVRRFSASLPLDLVPDYIFQRWDTSCGRRILLVDVD